MREGVQEWRNPRNRLAVLRIHWSADANKRSEAGRAAMGQLRAEIGERAWRREYEIDWASPEGEPVTPEFNPTVHVRALTADPFWRLLRFWDFGFVAPVVLFAQVAPMGQLRILRELCPFNTPLDQLIPMVRAITADLVRDPTKVFDTGDPAGNNQTDLGSSVDVLARHRIHMHTSRKRIEVSYAALRARLLKRLWAPPEGEIPAFAIDPSCRNLIEALSGAFHLSPHPPHKPIRVHPYTDTMDALRYGIDNLDAGTNDAYAMDLRRIATADIVDTYSSLDSAVGMR